MPNIAEPQSRPRPTRHPARHLALAGALTVLLAAAGCSDATGPVGRPVGTFVLRSIADRELPFALEATASWHRSIAADTLVLAEDGTYTEVEVDLIGVYDRPSNSYVTGPLTQRYAGTWTRDGAKVTLSENRFGGSSMYVRTATYGAGRLTLTPPAAAWEVPRAWLWTR